MSKQKEVVPPPIAQITQQTRTSQNQYLDLSNEGGVPVKPIIKRVSCVLLVVVWLPFNDIKPIVHTGDVHVHQTVVNGSNNMIVNEREELPK